MRVHSPSAPSKALLPEWERRQPHNTAQFLTVGRLRQRHKGLTSACKRLPIASAPASLRLLAAPDTQRSAPAAEDSKGRESILAGTIPLDIDMPGRGLDMVCAVERGQYGGIR